MNKISSWNRWDLHIHTRASKVRKGSSEYSGNGVSFTDEEIVTFTNKIFFSGGPKLIAITDHDYFDDEQFLKIKNAVTNKQNELNEDLCCLPGVECDVFFKMDSNKEIVLNDDVKNYKESERVHIVVIFNDNGWDAAKYLLLKEKICELYQNDDPIFINDVLSKFVDNQFEFVVIPHFRKSRGIEEAIRDNKSGHRFPENMERKTNWILSGYFPLLDGVKRDFINEQTKIFYETLNKKAGYEIPEILTSDNHDYNDYNKNVQISWYKAIPSFKGLKMCCSDYKMRVKFAPSEPVQSYISKISIKSIPGSEVVNEKDIFLSENLNCLIGGRSSGKSLLLKKVASCCGSSQATTELSSYTKYNKFFQVELFGNDGQPYKGDPEYVSQGSIIEKYIGKDNGENLANDFKDYFPNEVNLDSIKREKGEIISLVLSIDETLNKICTLSVNLLNKNIFDYLKISEVSLENSISNSNLLAKYKNAAAVVGNLYEFKETIQKASLLIKPYEKLSSELSTFLNHVNEEYARSFVKLKNYEIIKNASNKFINFLDETSKGYDKKVKTQLASIKTISNSVVEWTSLYGELIKYYESLRTAIEKLKQSNTYTNEFSSYKFSIKITNNLNITAIFDKFKERIKDKAIRESSTNFAILFDKVIFSKYETYSTKKLETLISDCLDESYSIDYLIYEKGELINNMSEGRKVGAYLSILLNRNNSIEPLIIDQPEDDMDNNDIYSILVDSIRKRKDSRQIIVATHDANVVVNGDAENVIYASKEKKKSKINYEFGGLEYEDKDFNVQKTICNVLEGGEDAFVNRALKYDLDKTKIYKWRGKEK